jgi:hypothetical protein
MKALTEKYGDASVSGKKANNLVNKEDPGEEIYRLGKN